VKSVKLAIDIMGTDKGPLSIVEAVHLAHQKHSDIEFHLFGPKDLIERALKTYPVSFARTCQIHDTPEFITNEEIVSKAIRRKNTSMRLALQAVADGHVDGIVSGGNTGAYMALATILLKTIPGVTRPAIATTFPTAIGKCILLDMGANIECSPKQLVEFAIMGKTFSSDLLNIESPSIGLLNIGHEELKGKPELHEAHQKLKNLPKVINYTGFVEGNDIPLGKADVVVTDGFTGNVTIKTAEGIGTVIAQVFKKKIQSNPLYKLFKFFSKGKSSGLGDHFNPVKYNGAMFLGLKSLAIKSHGGASAHGFANAIEVAYKLNQYDFSQQIERDLIASKEQLS
tara:strand:+ start:10443 stop:11465 length:1023 start_codon:yes stop_codon:yes gene_type:complete